MSNDFCRSHTLYSYKSVVNDNYRKLKRERNDCAVITLSLLTGKTYTYMHTICEYEGRKQKAGMDNRAIERVLRRYRNVQELRKIPSNPKTGTRLTMRTVGDYFTTGKYLCYTHLHCFALINGVVEDWAVNSKRPIEEMFKVT